jgi:hypothetical protein
MPPNFYPIGTVGLSSSTLPFWTPKPDRLLEERERLIAEIILDPNFELCNTALTVPF